MVVWSTIPPPKEPLLRIRQARQKRRDEPGRGRQQEGAPEGTGNDAGETKVVEAVEALAWVGVGGGEEEEEVVRGLRREGLLHLVLGDEWLVEHP